MGGQPDPWQQPPPIHNAPTFYPPFPGYPPPPGPGRKSPALLVAAIAIPAVLALVLLGATGFAVSQFVRSAPAASTAQPQWQPYVDAARDFAVTVSSVSAASIDADIQRVLDGSTGAFHDDFQKQADAFKQVVVTNGSTSHGTVSASGLESFTPGQAVVLVSVSTDTSTTASGTQNRAQRLVLTVVETAGSYKVSKVEFVP
ncbi:hypothetical protein [Mycobacterium aquaticum]|uniref:Mammalian cell entry protein n=1 Tax=Mycobacterium aquaticum TaxID=1927124 RepID=A0A1X0AIQ7_9MYCO|nr:hypothetical protein [Mycobacterium aquaticum]ORA29795.1 hypothetical protein BST13_27090 [Mycobacterium aquaticum]